ncbi:MAG: adenosylmethionine--8-amino-7-oxononanoate transaminase [Polyangiaceae bacterium]|jgi:adenosylmethionine-8-amino-7-oxononanoate aminotransferase
MPDSERSTLWYPYAQMRGLEEPLEVVAAKGSTLTLADGRMLVDAIASWWCVIHGYNHPELSAVVHAQIDAFAHVMLGGLTHAPAKRLADKLVEIAPDGLAHVFFADSGSVGMEVAMKMALQFHRNRGVAGRTRFLSLVGAYHGDTSGVMSLGDPIDGMHHLFRGYLPAQLFVRPPLRSAGPSLDEAVRELRSALQAHHACLAAMVLEPVMQGAGGFRVYEPDYLREVRVLCDRYDVPLIFDEVATGFGRTGKLFAAEHAQVSPDIMVLGKGLTAGYFGMSATLASERIYDAFLGEGPDTAFMHGPTFMGHATAAVVALKSIEVFRRDRYLDRIAGIEAQLRRDLLPLEAPGIVATRVFGAVGVVEVDSPARYAGLQRFAVDRGVWLRPFGRVVYTAPPYVITSDELGRVIGTLAEWFRR